MSLPGSTHRHVLSEPLWPVFPKALSGLWSVAGQPSQTKQHRWTSCNGQAVLSESLPSGQGGDSPLQVLTWVPWQFSQVRSSQYSPAQVWCLTTF